MPRFRQDKLTGKNYCLYHWKTYSTDIDKRSIVQKGMDKRKKEQGILIEVDENVESELQVWYGNIMKKEVKICWNCGADLKHYNKQDWHSSIAHVIPKQHFKSVQCHPLNYLILGKWCNCHGTYDSNWMKAAGMKIFPKAIERFILIEPNIARNERQFIPEVLLQELPPSIID